MKEYKLERAYKVATMAHNRLRKLSRLFQCAQNDPSAVYNDTYLHIEAMTKHAQMFVDGALDYIDLLQAWAVCETQSDDHLVSCMQEAIDSATWDRCGITALPNRWIFSAQKRADGVTCHLAHQMVPRSRVPRGDVVDLGIVQQRGTHSPRSLAGKALAYAKAHPEETTK